MERRLNQGCSLSPYLFNIALAPLDLEIKLHLQGIPLQQTTLKAIVYVDNALWIAKNTKEMSTLLKTLQDFSKASIIDINSDKIQMLIMDNSN